VRFGVFEVDLRAGELFKQGIKIKLQQQPLRVLALLLEHPGEVVTREELRAAIWPAGTFVEFDVGVDAAIHKLRSALGDSAENPRLVETLPRRGYRFIAKVDSVAASEAGQSERPAEEQASTDAAPPALPMPKGRPLLWTGAMAVVVAVLLAVNTGGLRVRLLGRAATPRIQSIAVLPLGNLSGDSTQEYFAEGMTEALVTRLGKTAGLGGLRVISHTSTMHFKGTRETLPEIARQLHVDAVIEGAVLRVGDRVRVTAQLIEASTDRHLWAETYERDLRDVLGLQDAIARAITNEVQMRVSSSQQSPVASTRARPVDPDAYDLYLRGRAEWNEWTEEGTRKSIEYFQRAVQRDPGYAPAWAGLSDAYAHMGQFLLLPARVASFKARAAAERAIQLDETLSEARVSLAGALLLQWSWSAGEKELQRAIALNPNSALAHQWYGWLLSARGQFDPAIREMRRALELDPLSPNKQNSLAATFHRAGRYDEALQYYSDVPDPDLNSGGRHRRIADIYERQGRFGEAMAEWLVVLRLGGKQEVAASVERDYRASGFAAAKRTYLWGHLREAGGRAHDAHPRPRPYSVAGDYALLGERDSAFAWLERAFRERVGVLMFLTIDDRFETLRSDPRFRDLARRIGLPDTAVQDSVLPRTY
ncbi:MAG TPA: tetratricopeptide repeat protein, partial [Gemmatimonadales bacterium]|nr:tetratricopeptide repeat protein [Gemmatimonadales bacterium]